MLPGVYAGCFFKMVHMPFIDPGGNLKLVDRYQLRNRRSGNDDRAGITLAFDNQSIEGSAQSGIREAGFMKFQGFPIDRHLLLGFQQIGFGSQKSESS